MLSMQYLQLPIPVIGEILANITSTKFVSILDLTSKYFQNSMKPENTAKTAFSITKNGCYAFKRMSFDVSGGTIHVPKVHE